MSNCCGAWTWLNREDIAVPFVFLALVCLPDIPRDAPLKIRRSDEFSVRLWGVIDGEKYTVTAGLGIDAGVTYHKGRRPKKEHLSARAVVLIPSGNGFVEITSKDCKVQLPPQDDTKVTVMTNIGAKTGWPPGDAIVRVFFYDKSNKTVTLLASDTKFVTFVPRER
jgi:hypothetical protein